MEFTSHNDLDLLIKMEHHGRPIRVDECVRFAVKVWTQNPSNHLLFTARDVIKDDRFDRLVIPGYQMAALESGVVVYEYSYSLTDRHFKPFEGHPHDHRNRVVTDQYWKNCNLNQVPSNPVNYQTLNYLRDLIEQEVADRENAIIDVKQYLDESFVNDLRKEIARSNEVDAELNNKINQTKEATDEAIKVVSDKLDAEVKRSNEVDIELFNQIKKVGQNTDNIKEETDGKIEETNTAIEAEADRAKEAEKQLSDAITAEADRAKAAEREINTALTDEVSRARTKEAEIDATIAAEVSRAKVVEGALTDGLDAVRDKANQIAADLASEISRSNQKDNDHTAAVTAEVTRATAAEKAITDRLDVIEGNKDVIGSIAHSLEDAKHYTDDQIGKANADSNAAIADNATAIATEVSRATTAEKALADRLDTAEASLNDTADTLVNLTNKDTEITNALNAEVSRAQTAEKALSDRVDVLETAANDTADAITNLVAKDTEITNTLNSEVSRAQTAEKANADAITALDGKVDAVKATADKAAADITAEVSRAQTKEGELSTAIASEASRATTKEGELEAALNVVNGDKDTIGSIAHAVEDANHYTDDEIAKLKTSTSTDLTNALKPYATKQEVDGRIEGIIGTAPAALDTLGEIADRLEGDSDAINAINGVLNGKANAADVYTKSEVDAQHQTMTTSVNALDGKVDAEVNRAKAAEKVNADNLTALSTKVDAVKAVSDKAAADLVDEVNRAKGVEAELSTKVNAVEAKADTNADGIASLVDDVATLETALNGAKTDINALSNDLASEVSRANTKEGELEAGIAANAQKVADLTTRTTAVEGEVSTIKTDVDAVEAAITAEVTRAQTAEKANADAITALSTKVDGVKTVADKAAADITAEVTRAQTKEGELEAALNVVNGDKTVIGSIAHAVEDSKHYTDDEISKLNAKVDAKVAGFVSVAALELKADKADVYTKSEVDAAIANVDVTEQLADYAKTADVAAAYQPKGDYLVAADIEGKADKSDTYTKSQVDTLGNQLKAIAEARLPIDSFNQWSEGVAMKNATTCIKDENGTVITEMVIDNSAEDDTIEVYTKAQVDEMFAAVPKIVNLTQAEYDALTTKAPNTLYIVNG